MRKAIISRVRQLAPKAVSTSIGALVLVPVFLGWLAGMLVFSFRAGYASAAGTLHTWAGPRK